MKLQRLLEDSGKALALKLQQLILDDEHGDHLHTRIMLHDEGYELSVWNDKKTVDFWCVIKDGDVYAPGGWQGEEDDDNELLLIDKDLLASPPPGELYTHMVELGCYTYAIYKAVRKLNAYEVRWDQDYVSFVMYPNNAADHFVPADIEVTIDLLSDLRLNTTIKSKRAQTYTFDTIDDCIAVIKKATRS